MEEKEFSYEKEHLRFIINKINEYLYKNTAVTSDLKTQIVEQRARIWEDFSRGSLNPSTELQEVMQITQTEQNDTARFERLQQQAERLYRQKKSPYFARIDFSEDEEKTESFYIGQSSFIDEENSDVYICDWRADISSLFYNQGLGKTFYNSPIGRIYGNLSLRRQFKIENSKLKYMFDSDIAIEDDILRDELGKNADLKLKTIVSTIQKEQNIIIRETDCDLLLVQGVAGSGKTSIALHRIAYLLYHLRNSLSSSNIIIFSPSNVWNSYISDVLPELGEERVIQKGFYDFFASFFEDFSVEGYAESMERHLNIGYLERETDKCSEDFCKALENYFITQGQFKTEYVDIVFDGNVILTAEDFKKYYEKIFRNYAPAMRKNKIISIVMQDIENEYKDRYLDNYIFKLQSESEGSIKFTDFEEQLEKEKEWHRVVSSINEIINGAFGSVNIKQAYLTVVKENIPECYEECVRNFEQRRMNYEDLFPMTYLKYLRGDIRPYHKISQIVVDEAQDYPPLVYILLNKIFIGAKFTILGDISQKTNISGCKIEDIKEFFPKKSIKYYRLNRSYRSTKEINDYLKTIDVCDDNRDVEYLDREGSAVEFKNLKSAEELIDILKSFKSENYFSNAVICRDFKDCVSLFEKIKNYINISLIGEDDAISPDRNVIIPSYLSKGLEFDAVVAFDRREEFESDDQIFYVASSRALHKLVVAKPDKSLFE